MLLMVQSRRLPMAVPVAVQSYRRLPMAVPVVVRSYRRLPMAVPVAVQSRRLPVAVPVAVQSRRLPMVVQSYRRLVTVFRLLMSMQRHHRQYCKQRSPLQN
jgi:hypothetical protein